MPIVTKTISNLTVGNDPTAPLLNTHVDLAMLLSEYYGKSIRQGMNFKLAGVSATVYPRGGDWDTGASCLLKHQFIPTTAHSKKAWNMTFNQWKKQQKLTTRGAHMRYNDFEVGWDSSSSYHNSSRVSKLFSTGLGDETDEIVVLTGNSSAADDFSIQDMYNSQVRPLHQGVDHFGITTPKGPKYDYSTRFPAVQEFYIGGYTSSGVSTKEDPILGVISLDMYSGSKVGNAIQEFPMPLNVLCGVMKLNVYVPTDDTAAQLADEFDIVINYFVKSWSPLAKRAKSNRRKSTKKTMRRFRGRRKTRRYNRR